MHGTDAPFCLEPGDSLSPTAALLLAGTSAEPFLDRAAPRSIDSAPPAEQIIAIRNPAIRFELTGAVTWDLTSVEFDEKMRDELQARAEHLAEQLSRG